MSKKPRVLVCVNQPIPISETFVYNQSMRLNSFEAFIVGSRRPSRTGIDLPPQQLCLVNQGGVSGWSRELAWKVLGYVPADVVEWARSLRPLVVHSHFGPYGLIGMPLAKRLGIPLVVSFHGTDATLKPMRALRSAHFMHRLFILRRRALSRFATRFVVQSDYVRRIVIDRLGLPAEKVVTIRHGIDLEDFRPEEDASEWGHVLYVGRLIDRKGLPMLIRALGEVRRRHNGVKLTVIGDGPKREAYEALARQELREGFQFLGARPQADVREYMKRAYLFCMPSVTMPDGEAETQGMVFVEAMAMCVPVVSFASGGIPEVVRHGDTGLLAPEGDIPALVDHLTTLLDNPTMRDMYGARGREWVEQEFNLERQNMKLERLYHDLAPMAPSELGTHSNSG